ncbi:MAG: hypothetical protein A3F20_00030 [Candidatus Zambryskibacteria bacterium RIFCSPHIGHO2_12_FULL_39_21]|nr:MAG: hypothetical protein A3F20_00030 [Candidatus Zambryskibacteria bacterium RIFCSPHIGHO2_12_FULL_39_21]
MRLKKVADLLRHFPVRYGEAGRIKATEFLIAGEDVVIFGKISNLKTAKTFKSHVPIGTAEVEDSTGKIKIIWFSQPYIAKMFFEGDLVRVEGRVSQRRTKIPSTNETKISELYFSNPKIEKVSEVPEGASDSLFPGEDGHSLSPVYPESRGISSNWIYHFLQKIFRSNVLENIEDHIPPEILKKYNLPSLKTSLIWIHAPRKKEDAEVARKRFAFEEIFLFSSTDKKKNISPRKKILSPYQKRKKRF